MKIYVSRNGQVLGPYTIAETREYLAIGRLVPDDAARREDMTTWEPLSAVMSKPLRSRRGGLVVLGGLALALFAVAVMIVVALSWEGSKVPPPVPMNASVRQSALGVTVTNGSTHLYEDVTIKINYSISGSGEYSARMNRIAAGDSVLFPYAEFTNSANQRFNYAATSVDRVMVRAKVGDTYNWQEFGK